MRYNGLKGDGFIVLRAGDANTNFFEYENEDEAKGFAALQMAEKPGVMIIYAPVAIIRPRLNADVEMTSAGENLLRGLSAPSPRKRIK